MSELVMNIKHQYYKNLFKLSCKLHAPISEWAWKTVVYEKKRIGMLCIMHIRKVSLTKHMQKLES